MFLGVIRDVGERREPIETCESVPRTLDHWVHFDILRMVSIPERAFPVRVHVENAGTLPWRCQRLAHARERFCDLNTGRAHPFGNSFLFFQKAVYFSD
jgi:hypothetical protein